MADAKISQLPVATSSAGTDVLPIVQSSTTKQLAIQNLVPQNLKSNATTGVLQVTGPAAGTTRVMTAPDANFTAARTDSAQSFTGNQTLGTGNLIVGTAGKGIDFTANSGGILSMFKESTYTPVLTNFTIVGTHTVAGKYTRIGTLVFVTITIAGMTSIANATYTGEITLPFVPAYFSALCSMSHGNWTNSVGGVIIAGDQYYPAAWTATADTVTVNAIYICV